MCLPAPLCEHFPPSCSFKGVLKFNHIVLHQSSLEIFEPNGCFLGECLNQNFSRKCIFLGGYGAVTHPLCLLPAHSFHPSFSDTWFLDSIYITWLKTLPQPIKRLLWNPKLWLKGWSFPGVHCSHRWLTLVVCSTGEKVAFSLQAHTPRAFPWELLVLFRLLF